MFPSNTIGTVRYLKLDVEINHIETPENDEVYLESRNTKPGDSIRIPEIYTSDQRDRFFEGQLLHDILDIRRCKVRGCHMYVVLSTNSVEYLGPIRQSLRVVKKISDRRFSEPVSRQHPI